MYYEWQYKYIVGIACSVKNIIYHLCMQKIVEDPRFIGKKNVQKRRKKEQVLET